MVWHICMYVVVYMFRDACFFVQVVDHSGSAEEGAALIYAQLEKIIKQVHILSYTLTT